MVAALKKGEPVALTDLAKNPEFRGVHFKRMMSAADALVSLGLVTYDQGNVSLKETYAMDDSTLKALDEIRISMQESRKPLVEGSKWRVGKAGRGEDEEVSLSLDGKKYQWGPRSAYAIGVELIAMAKRLDKDL